MTRFALDNALSSKQIARAKNQHSKQIDLILIGSITFTCMYMICDLTWRWRGQWSHKIFLRLGFFFIFFCQLLRLGFTWNIHDIFIFHLGHLIKDVTTTWPLRFALHHQKRKMITDLKKKKSIPLKEDHSQIISLMKITIFSKIPLFLQMINKIH